MVQCLIIGFMHRQLSVTQTDIQHAASKHSTYSKPSEHVNLVVGHFTLLFRSIHVLLELPTDCDGFFIEFPLVDHLLPRVVRPTETNPHGDGSEDTPIGIHGSLFVRMFKHVVGEIFCDDCSELVVC